MGVGSQRTKVNDLLFQVFDRAIHPEWLPERAHRRINRDGWEADLRLLDGGHAVTWAYGPHRLTEILSPADLPLPDLVALFRSQVRYEKTARLNPAPGLEYQTSVEAERVEPEVFIHLYAELTLDARRSGIAYRENPANRFLTPRLSHLTFDARPRGLAVQTVHTFPDERAIVRVQSLFERTKA
ncbi:MAG: hypothetical protein KatS3mg108_0882 [Isosphaeraceae bacterium]|jgi:hypothetical protein|nr:MAG: hypothetical protein KatS3mg108_0882 [Isosphaeraceae bacterium]